MDHSREPPQCEKTLPVQTDEDLLAAVERDPEGGITQILDRYGARLNGRLRRHALLRRYGDADVDDIFQEAILRLLDPELRTELIAAGGQILPWLSRWGYWRLDDAANRKGVPLPENLTVPGPAGPETTAFPSEPIVALRLLLPLLSPRQRMILRMRYETGLTERAVAERLGMSLAATKKAAHDARERLRSLMIEAGINFK